MRKSCSRIPAPLRWLLPVVLVAGVAWALFTPPFQVPDETVHYAFTESLAERGARPHAEEPNLELSTESRRLLSAANALNLIFDGYAKPPWSERAEKRYGDTATDGPRDDGGGQSYASNNQPLYYLLEVLPYEAGGSTADRLFLMRIVSALWLLVTAVGAWLLAGEVFGRRRLPQLLCASTLGLWPMIDFITAGVNPDGMLIALSTLALWLAVRIARGGTTLLPAVSLIVVVLLATVTKIAGAALAPAAAFAIVAGLPAVRARVGDSVPRLLALGVGMAVVAGAGLLVGNVLGVLPPQLQFISDKVPDPVAFASYLWQFYLPNPGFLNDQSFNYPVISELGVYNTWFGMSWGVYGWVNVWFAKWIYAVFFGIALAVLAGGLRTAGRAVRDRRDTLPSGGSAAAVITLALAIVAVLAGVHLSDYLVGAKHEPPFAQGRYLFPVAGVGGLCVAGALEALPVRARPAAAAGWLGLLIVLQLAAFSLVAGRFYA